MSTEGEDLESLEAAQAAPENNVTDIKAQAQGEITHMTEQLGLVGKQLSPLAALSARVETLIDLTFATDEQREYFECGAVLRLHRMLRSEIEQLQSQLIVPSGSA